MGGSVGPDGSYTGPADMDALKQQQALNPYQAIAPTPAPMAAPKSLTPAQQQALNPYQAVQPAPQSISQMFQAPAPAQGMTPAQQQALNPYEALPIHESISQMMKAPAPKAAPAPAPAPAPKAAPAPTQKAGAAVPAPAVPQDPQQPAEPASPGPPPLPPDSKAGIAARKQLTGPALKAAVQSTDGLSNALSQLQQQADVDNSRLSNVGTQLASGFAPKQGFDVIQALARSLSAR